jgi:hypothetical protein
VERFRLFFSNRTVDQERVDQLQSTLRELLPNMPFDDVSKGVPFIDDWRTPASSILASCDALICVVGPETHKSQPIDWEIREAHRLGKPLVVARENEACALPQGCADLHLSVVRWESAELAGIIGELLVSRALFLHHDWRSGSPDPTMIWNQYDLMVRSWEALIARRQAVNTIYVSASAALLAGVGVMISAMDRLDPNGAATGAALLSLLGAGLSFNWRRTVISYGTLSKAKSRVVAALEAHLPAQLFDAEWRVLEARRYKSTTDTDKQTALFFMLLFLAVAVVAWGIALGRRA